MIDALFLAGFALGVYGAALIYRPLGWLAAGAGLIGLAVVLARLDRSDA